MISLNCGEYQIVDMYCVEELRCRNVGMMYVQPKLLCDGF